MIAANETVETVSKRVEANRRNSRHSTGPRTAEGKSRVRLNALKHGLTAQTLVLPGESAELLEARREAWKAELQPQSELEDYVLERVVHASWHVDRCDRAIASRLTARVRFGGFDRDEAEVDEVEDLARQLFWDPRGPIALYPHWRGLRVTPRISYADSPSDPLNPARLVNRLDATSTGCRWLLDRWTDLRQVLEQGLKWQAPDRLRAIRLLGRQPMDLLADERVLLIYLACDAMDPQASTSLNDMRTETDDVELERITERVQGRGGEWKKPASPEAGREALLALIEQMATQLEVKLGVHRARREFEKAVQSDLLAFDDSPEGELMRRYQLAKGREFNRLLATYFKVRREALAAADCESPVAGGIDRDAQASAAVEVPIGPEPILVAGPESAGWVQPTDANPVEPVACDERPSAPPTLPEPVPDPLQGDETNPIPAEDSGDETKPTPPEPPAPAIGQPTLEEYLAAAMARLDPSRPLPPMFHGALREPERRSMS